MVGRNCMRNKVAGQGVIAISSGEAEYYGLTLGMSQALGDVSLARDWNIRLRCHIWMGATTGIAMGSRRGLGNVKHIDTVFLWCQEVVNAGRATLGKKHTKEMLADMNTKVLTLREVEGFMSTMGYEFRNGRHSLALGA